MSNRGARCAACEGTPQGRNPKPSFVLERLPALPDRGARLLDGLITARQGHGPLLQRDYWAVIANCRLEPREVAALVARDFCHFPPENLVHFHRLDGSDGPLEIGAELDVDIRVAGECRVRVVHRDAQSLTLATLSGHPEAGRITFGAYPNRDGDVVFHIRSRSRSSSRVKLAAFFAVGEPMQTTTWTDFIDRLAHTVGDGVIGGIVAETREVKDEPDDAETLCAPTFVAGDGSGEFDRAPED